MIYVDETILETKMFFISIKIKRAKLYTHNTIHTYVVKVMDTCVYLESCLKFRYGIIVIILLNIVKGKFLFYRETIHRPYQ